MIGDNGDALGYYTAHLEALDRAGIVLLYEVRTHKALEVPQTLIDDPPAFGHYMWLVGEGIF